MKTLSTLSLAALAAAIGLPAHAASNSATGTATADVVKPLTISAADDIWFGMFSPGPSGSGTIDTLGNVTNGVVKLAGGLPGTFTVNGEPAYSYTVLGDASVTLNSGVDSMSAALTYPGVQILDGSGGDSFSVQGVLTVPSTQPGGSYSGTYNVTVNYQ